jgi:hypothetical protein
VQVTSTVSVPELLFFAAIIWTLVDSAIINYVQAWRSYRRTRSDTSLNGLYVFRVSVARMVRGQEFSRLFQLCCFLTLTVISLFVPQSNGHVTWRTWVSYLLMGAIVVSIRLSCGRARHLWVLVRDSLPAGYGGHDRSGHRHSTPEAGINIGEVRPWTAAADTAADRPDGPPPGHE